MPGEAKTEIVLAQSTRRAAERVDVAADRAAIAVVEVLPVVQLRVAHHPADPETRDEPGERRPGRTASTAGVSPSAALRQRHNPCRPDALFSRALLKRLL